MGVLSGEDIMGLEKESSVELLVLVNEGRQLEAGTSCVVTGQT
jgi:hypothetical protein